MTKRAKKPKSVLKLPDLDYSKSAVLNSLPSVNSRRSYDHAIRDFIEWYCSEPRLAFNKTVVTRYRIDLEQRRYAPSTINLRLAAVRRLAYEASDNGLLSPDLAAGIRRVKGAKRLGIRLGNWLTSTQGRELLGVPDRASVKGKRNYAKLAVLLGCGLRRSELTRLTVSHLQQRDGHWAIVDLFGKGGHVRTVPVPAWVKVAIDSWLAIAGIDTGIIFRCVSRTGHVWGNRLSEKAVWWVVREYAKLAGIDNLAPHDLRRTCARLCHSAGGNLNKSSFCSATGLWKLQNDTWVRGRDWCRQSTITSGSNRQAAHK